MGCEYNKLATKCNRCNTTYLCDGVNVSGILVGDSAIGTFVKIGTTKDGIGGSGSLVSSTPAIVDHKQLVSLVDADVIPTGGTFGVILAACIVVGVNPVTPLVKVSNNAFA